MEEEGKHLQAFEVFYSLGNKRTLGKLSKKIDVSVPTLSRWSKEFNWNKRIDQRNRMLFEKMRKENAEEFEKAIIINQKGLLELLKKSFLEPLQNGDIPIKIETPSDLEKIVKLYVLLGGGVTSRSETINKEAKTEGENRVVELIQQDGETWEKLNQKFIEGEYDDR